MAEPSRPFRPHRCGSSALSRAGRVALTTAAALALSWMPGGCASNTTVGSLAIESLGENPVVLPSSFSQATYQIRPEGETSIVLTTVPPQALREGTVERGQVLHIAMLWEPRGGQTPISDAATNATVRLLLIVDGQVGVYGGAGFVRPHGRVGNETLSFTLRDATLKLLDATDGFNDLLTPASITGRFAAARDADATQRLRYTASQYATDALGRTRFVHTPGEAPVAAPLAQR